MNKDVVKKYKIVIQDVEDYILKKNGRKRAIRKQWTAENRAAWKLRCPKCPMCDESYDEDSNPITKEHIIPIFLGGRERDSNIMPLCKKCNHDRDKVMKKLLSTTEIATIRERWPAIKPAVTYFIIWCHVSLNNDYDSQNQVKDLNDAFALERNIDFPLKNRALFLERINNSKSLFSSLVTFLRNIIIKKEVFLSSDLDMESHSKSSPVPVEKSKVSINEDKQITNKKPDVIFDLDSWVIDNWKNKSDYNALKSLIIRHEKKNGGDRKLRTILKEDHGIPKSWSIAKISAHFEELKSNTKSPSIKPQLNLEQEPESTVIPSREDFKIILAKNIAERIGANTYRDGFKISQITYIFKQNKDKYDLSWNKFFSHLDVKYQENVETTSKNLIQELDLIIKDSVNKDGDQIYIISKSDIT